MRKILVLMMMFTAFISCKDDQKKDTDVTSEEKAVVAEEGKTLKQSDGLIAIQGNFIYSKKDNAAVLQTATKIYGLVIDEKLQELNTLAKPYKQEDTDMVPVTIRGRMFKKDPETEGWEDRIEIKEILKVTAPDLNENEVIKVGSK
ncbi:hypothetical protein [Psychroserpens sp. SPM9]|uniref:hypothetical protein n=1 Tax=Psychroserpens sp. SPM9 TaxID=2975598 RepID=UPI0021A6702B|nr:hypothetical protein [Psychroserpens sp. SPM9]MDG5490928.1 hypothetical protein [Psychroserpens sp. SPM9]